MRPKCVFVVFFFFIQISRNTRLQVIGKITLCEVLIGLSLWKVGSFPGCDISQFTSVLTIAKYDIDK